MEKISAVYKIVNTLTGDFYIGSSKNVYSRWAVHKCQSTWMNHPNNLMYQDMQKYGVDKFRFQILSPVEPEYLKQVEQELIELLKPTYNNNNAKGLNTERWENKRNKYRQSNKGREIHKVSNRKWRHSEKGKTYYKAYNNQLCLYKGEKLTLCALRNRFKRAGIIHPDDEAKKYLIQ